ncbi:unnamed protein product, partial [Closterium sp. Yama58-4]
VHETWMDGIEELRSCIMEKCPEGGKAKLQQDLDEAYHLVEQRIEEHMEAFKTRALATAFALPPSLQAHLASLPPHLPRATAAPAGSEVGAGGDDDLAAEAAALDAELAELNATLAKVKSVGFSCAVTFFTGCVLSPSSSAQSLHFPRVRVVCSDSCPSSPQHMLP